MSLSVDTDAVVPEFLADELAASLSGLRSHVKITSRYGHDAFLKGTRAISAFIRSGLAEEGR